MLRTLVISIMVLLSSGRGESAEPFVVAHRGLLRHAPENTPAAFRSCLALRFGFEFDVQRSRDGHLVCVHDDTLDRTTNGRGPVRERTLAELKFLDAGRWFAASFAGERIPAIPEILDLVRADAGPSTLMAVDLKDADPAVGVEVIRLAEDRGTLNRLLFIGATIRSRDLRQALRSQSQLVQTAAVVENSAELQGVLEDATATWAYLRYVPAAEEVQRCHAVNKPVFVAGPHFAGEERA
ncbi:MAG: hypothetical protein B7Z55_06795, partial [Planctomycetales bacterium 12-60-4]